MRRKDREITDWDSMLDMVQHCDCCRLGLLDEDGAYILPLNFGAAVEDGVLALYFHGAQEGKKIALLRKNPHISFEMDTGHRLVPGAQAAEYTFAYRSVMGRGTVTFLETDAEKLRGLNSIMAHYTHRDDWTVDPTMLRATAVFRLQVESWSAKEHHLP